MPEKLIAPNGEEVNEAMMEKLMRAQLRKIHEMTAKGPAFEGDIADYGGYISDDGYDYMGASLDLGSKILDLWYEMDLEGLHKLLTSENGEDEDLLANYACDGICNELWDISKLKDRD